MITNPEPLKIEIEYPLCALIMSCERQCVAGCCGIDAFDFSPLFIAAYLSTHNGEVRDWDVAAIHDQIRILRANYCQLPLQNIEYTLQIEAMNQNFTSQQFDALLNEIEYNLDQASSIWKHSNSLRLKMQNKSDRRDDLTVAISELDRSSIRFWKWFSSIAFAIVIGILVVAWIVWKLLANK